MSNRTFWERIRIWLSQLIWPSIWNSYYDVYEKLYVERGEFAEAKKRIKALEANCSQSVLRRMDVQLNDLDEMAAGYPHEDH